MSKVVMYRFKVSLIGRHKQPINKLHRIIDVSENTSFHDFHETIFSAFDRYDPHFYKFFLTRKEVKSEQKLFDCKEIVAEQEEFGLDPFSEDNETSHDSIEFSIADAKLKEKDFMYYWFDFGDDWLHRIRVEKIYNLPLDEALQEDEFLASIVKKVGESPAQYDENSIWEGTSEDAEMQKIFMSMMTIILPGGEEVATWENLNDFGAAELLLEKGLIEKPNSPQEPVKLTAEGVELGNMLKEMMPPLT